MSGHIFLFFCPGYLSLLLQAFAPEGPSDEEQRQKEGGVVELGGHPDGVVSVCKGVCVGVHVTYKHIPKHPWAEFALRTQ